MTLLGLDLNATRARAVRGPAGEYPRGLPLEPPDQDLPMVLSLQNYRPEVGRSGLRLVRNLPHLTCAGFFTHLGKNGSTMKRWHAGRHHLDSSQALAIVWKQLEFASAKSKGTVLALPAYLTRVQAELASSLGAKHHVKILGSLSSLLAAALAGYAEQAWVGAVLVLDIDDHALSMGLVRATDSQAHLVEARHFPELGLKVWEDRLINALADSCVLQSRRDPRDVPQAEQALFDQLDELLEAGADGRTMQLAVEAPQWYQNLLVDPMQTSGFCAHLARQTAHAVGTFMHLFASEEPPAFLLLTAKAGRLPGLAARLRLQMEEAPGRSQEFVIKPRTYLEDFGEGLLQEAGGQFASVAILNPEAQARAAHGLGASFLREELPSGHQDVIAPLPLPLALEDGPARLRVQGQDHCLTAASFLLGARAGCHLIFDNQLYPTVAARHCEIQFHQGTYMLGDRAHEATLVNDVPISGSVILHAGDWIRLGAEGPVVRFLGNADE
jgi:FHA domain